MQGVDEDVRWHNRGVCTIADFIDGRRICWRDAQHLDNSTLSSVSRLRCGAVRCFFAATTNQGIRIEDIWAVIGGSVLRIGRLTDSKASNDFHNG